MKNLTKQEIITKAVIFAKKKLIDDIIELENFLGERPYSKGQRANLEKKLEGMRQTLIEFKTINLEEL